VHNAHRSRDMMRNYIGVLRLCHTIALNPNCCSSQSYHYNAHSATGKNGFGY
jgi:hypothetical protein